MFEYLPHFLPQNVVVIGVGGTGSRLIPPLAQLLKTSMRKFTPSAWIENINLWLIDGDTVEHKNLARQNFIEADVGQNKARVLAKRYSKGFGIPIRAVPKFMTVNDGGTFDGEISKESYKTAFFNSIVIMAVDSAQARRDILQAVFSWAPRGNFFFIDAGNEDDFGQVKISTGHKIAIADESTWKNFTMGIPTRIPKRLQLPYLPMDFDYYENLGESVQERSCADLPQTLAINSMMAQLILSNVQNFLLRKPMGYECQYYGLNGTMTTQQLTCQLMESRIRPYDMIYDDYRISRGNAPGETKRIINAAWKNAADALTGTFREGLMFAARENSNAIRRKALETSLATGEHVFNNGMLSGLGALTFLEYDAMGMKIDPKTGEVSPKVVPKPVETPKVVLEKMKEEAIQAYSEVAMTTPVEPRPRPTRRTRPAAQTDVAETPPTPPAPEFPSPPPMDTANPQVFLGAA